MLSQLLFAFTGELCLFQYKIEGYSEKFKNQQRSLLRLRSVHTCQKRPEISRETLRLNCRKTKAKIREIERSVDVNKFYEEKYSEDLTQNIYSERLPEWRK